MVNTISIRELRPNLAKVIENINEKFDRYIVTKRGVPEVVMLSVDDYESIMETLDIESDKDLMKRIQSSQKALEQGKGVSLDQLNEELKSL